MMPPVEVITLIITPSTSPNPPPSKQFPISTKNRESDEEIFMCVCISIYIWRKIIINRRWDFSLEHPDCKKACTRHLSEAASNGRHQNLAKHLVLVLYQIWSYILTVQELK